MTFTAYERHCFDVTGRVHNSEVLLDSSQVWIGSLRVKSATKLKIKAEQQAGFYFSTQVAGTRIKHEILYLWRYLTPPSITIIMFKVERITSTSCCLRCKSARSVATTASTPSSSNSTRASRRVCATNLAGLPPPTPRSTRTAKVVPDADFYAFYYTPSLAFFHSSGFRASKRSNLCCI